MGDFPHIQDEVGQLPFLKSYQHMLLCFPVAEKVSRDSLVDSLHDAALKLTTTFPWLAGRIVNEGSGPGNSGRFKLVKCEKFAPPNTIMRIKDCSDSCPPYEEISRARGPITMFDSHVLAPYRAFPEGYQDSEDDPAPAALFQANFIKGGLLLNLAVQHNLIDGGGLFQLLKLLATAMRGEEFPEKAVQQGNRDRRKIIPLLGEDEKMLDFSHLRLPPPSQRPPPRDGPRPPAPWCYFRVPAEKAKEIKALATKPELFDPAVKYISSNDALSAFSWKRITEIRQRRKPMPDATSKFCRAMDARKAMGVPTEYMGHMVHMATTWLTFKELEEKPLAYIASALRKSVNEVNNEYSLRSFVTLIANEPDKSTIGYGGTFNPDTDVGSSSLSHSDIYGSDFGLLGKPELIRRANFSPLESDVYFWPQTANGDFDLLLNFTEADIEALKHDEEWTSYVNTIG